MNERMTMSSRNSPAKQPINEWTRIATAYARDAAADVKGKKYSKWTRLAAQRFLDDLESQNTDAFPYYFSDAEAEKACKFFSLLPHVEGTWETPTIKLAPWQVFIIANIFGWRRLSDGRRRFNTVYIEVPRKNGKSIFASGVALYCLCCEGEVGPQVKCAATTGDQARIVFDVAKAMVEKLPKLRTAFKLEPFKDAIACYKTGGNIRPINAKASTQDGLNPHCCILDELHAHKTRDLFDVLKSARGARKNPLSLYITTAGYNTLGVCYEQHTFLKKILERVIRAEHYFGVIYTIDENDDPLDENTWKKANPNWDVINQDELRSYAVEAKQSPEMMAEFRTKRLNIWTTAKNGYINIIRWQECKGDLDLTDISWLESVPCWAAFDLSSTSDLTSIRLVWRLGERVLTWGKNYLPEDVVEGRSEKNGLPYRTWVERGYITVTPGNVIDYAYIERDLKELLDRFRVKAVAYDSWQARDLTNRLMADGVPLVEFRQGPSSYHPAMKEVERLYLSKKLEHGGDPVLTWNASNIVARRDANDNIAPDKKNSFEKIDGFVAMTMAIGIMISGEGVMVEGESVYNDRGILEIEI